MRDIQLFYTLSYILRSGMRIFTQCKYNKITKQYQFIERSLFRNSKSLYLIPAD